jgi:hypothetical protein
MATGELIEVIETIILEKILPYMAVYYWFPLKIMSNSHALHPRWPPLLKIEISSNGQNCFILRQNVSNFELYKHNDELFSIYYRIFE